MKMRLISFVFRIVSNLLWGMKKSFFFVFIFEEEIEELRMYKGEIHFIYLGLPIHFSKRREGEKLENYNQPVS